MRRKVTAPKDLQPAHELFKGALRKAYHDFTAAKILLGFCAVTNCFEKAAPKRRMCEADLAKARGSHKKWRVSVGKGEKVPNKGRKMCQEHGVWLDVCGCPPENVDTIYHAEHPNL
jgi:hypothetical protein